jgi:amidase
MTLAEYDDLDGLAMAALVRQRQVTATELLAEAIARLERVNPLLNAVVTPLYEQGQSAAAGPLPDGPFRGVPFLLKDLGLALAGAPLSFGSRFLAGFHPVIDSTLVERYRRAGLVVFGKTNTPEFGLTPYTESALFGPARNPWAHDHTPGGSSGGAAVAVAARVVPLAHASDGGGSIRIPASCCGLFGMKPTRGRMPVGPDRSEIWGGLSIDHVLTRSVRDSAAMLDATAGADHVARHHAPLPVRPFSDEVGAPPGRLRIALTTRPHLSTRPVDADCAAAVEDTGKLLADLGHDVEEAALPIDAESFARDFLVLVCVEMATVAVQVVAAMGRRPRRNEIEVDSALSMIIGRQQSAIGYAMARDRLNATARRISTFFERFDVLVSPTLARPPFPIGTLRARGAEAWARRVVVAARLGWVLRLPGVLRASTRRLFDFAAFTPVANVTGQPSMSVPLHWNAAGLPIGTMFTARFGAEAILFRLAAQLESARPWRDRRPPGSSSLPRQLSSDGAGGDAPAADGPRIGAAGGVPAHIAPDARTP